MKVFISWAGERSKRIAEIFRKWLPSVIQAIKPYFSPDDISKGSRWSIEIAAELEKSKIGLIILTPGNTETPWINFEAGALSKNLGVAKICPILFDLGPSDLQGPLSQFQGSIFEKNEIKKVLIVMNKELGDNGLSSEVLENVFEMWWPQLEKQINEIKVDEKLPKKSERTEQDLLSEILSLSRSMAQNRTFGTFHPEAIEDLVNSFNRLVRFASSGEMPRLMVDHLRELYRPIEYIVLRSDKEHLFIDDLKMSQSVLFDRIQKAIRIKKIRINKPENNPTEK